MLRLVEQADALIEGFRPGVTERLGLGPDECLARNPRLVYGRMTGWGQDGPLAHAAGHDINYISLAGALAHFGRAGAPPTPPLEHDGRLRRRRDVPRLRRGVRVARSARSGQGQVIDAAMVDGAAYLMGPMWGMRGMGLFSEERGTNLLDTGSPFYDVYETADGHWVVDRLDRAAVLRRSCSSSPACATTTCPRRWTAPAGPRCASGSPRCSRSKTRAEWTELLEGTDVCFAPVLPMSEVSSHPHLVARGSIVEHDGMEQPVPAPRFSRTEAEIQGPAPLPGEHTDAVLASFGFTDDEIAKLRGVGRGQAAVGLSRALNATRRGGELVVVARGHGDVPELAPRPRRLAVSCRCASRAPTAPRRGRASRRCS